MNLIRRGRFRNLFIMVTVCYILLDVIIDLRTISSQLEVEFPRKNGHPKKLELHPDNTTKGFFDARRNVFSVDC